MPDDNHLQAIGTIIGVACAAALAWWTAKREARKPAAPPPERAPTEHEVKAQLSELRSRIDHAHDIAEDDRRAIGRQLDRIERTMNRVCDRMDSDARLGSALAQMGKGRD